VSGHVDQGPADLLRGQVEKVSRGFRLDFVEGPVESQQGALQDVVCSFIPLDTRKPPKHAPAKQKQSMLDRLDQEICRLAISGVQVFQLVPHLGQSDVDGLIDRRRSRIK